jgi:hypothetical protein
MIGWPDRPDSPSNRKLITISQKPPTVNLTVIAHGRLPGVKKDLSLPRKGVPKRSRVQDSLAPSGASRGNWAAGGRKPALHGEHRGEGEGQ